MLRLSWREVLIRSLSTMRRQWLEVHLAYRPKAHRFSSIMGNTTFSILHGRRMICVPNLYTVPTRLPVRMKGVYFSRIVGLRRAVLSTPTKQIGLLIFSVILVQLAVFLRSCPWPRKMDGLHG